MRPRISSRGLAPARTTTSTKPPQEDELLARVSVGVRVVKLQQALADRVRSLEEALSNVKQPAGAAADLFVLQEHPRRSELLGAVETYISDTPACSSPTAFVPTCYVRYVKPELDELEAKHVIPDGIAGA